MKKADLSKGLIVAVSNGGSSNDWHPSKSRKAEVVDFGLRRRRSSVADGVRIKLIPDDLDSTTTLQYVSSPEWDGKAPPEGTLLIPSSSVWAPWEDVKQKFADWKRERAEEVATLAERNERMEAVKTALKDRGFEQGDLTFRGFGSRAALDGKVTVDINLLERLLGIEAG